MKKYLFALILIPCLVNAQWKTKSGSNKFDGNYKSAYAVGNSKNRLYKNPIFHINSFNGDEPNIYIDNIGYTGCSAAAMEVTFDNFEDILIYSSSTNNGNDAAFFSFDYGEMVELLQLLKDKKKVFVRYSNNCGSEEFEFNLNGSTASINYVTKDYIEKQLIEIKEKEELDKEKRIKEEREKELRAKEKAKITNQVKLEFSEELLNAFDFGEVGMDKSLVKEILSFKISSTKRIIVTSKKCPNRSILYNKEEAFFASDRLTLFNRIRDNAILIEGKSDYGTIKCSYYVNILELKKLTYNDNIKTIEELWPKLVELCEE